MEKRERHGSMSVGNGTEGDDEGVIVYVIVHRQPTEQTVCLEGDTREQKSTESAWNSTQANTRAVRVHGIVHR